MVDMNTYWPVALVLGLGTFLIRFSFIIIMDKIAISDAVMRLLRFIPASVLTAMIVPSVLLHKSGSMTFAGWERLCAALAAVVVAWRTKNVFATIGTGLLVMWGLKAVL